MKKNIELLINWIKNKENFINKAKEDQIGLYSSQAVFYVIISAVPFVMFLLSLLRYAMPVDLDAITRAINLYLPKDLAYWAVQIIKDIYTDASISLTSITAITTLWAASKSVHAINNGLATVYETKEKTNALVMRIKSLLYTLGFIVIIVISLILLVFSKQFIDIIVSYVPSTLVWLANFVNLSTIMFIIILAYVFALLFKISSGLSLPINKHLPGAVFVSLGWLLFSKIFYIYVNSFADFSLTYGALATIVIMMLWLKICIQILLFGAEFNMYLNVYSK